MAVLESDLQQLEEYLDEALGEQEASALGRRLGEEAGLAGALEEIRAGRALRRQLWGQMEDEVDAAAVQRVFFQVRRRARRQQSLQRVTQSLRYVAAVAACVLAGIWIGSNKSPSPIPVNPVASTNRVYQVTVMDDSGRAVAYQHFDSLDGAVGFAKEWNRFQERQQQIVNGHIVLVADRF